jgi:hypothetical protein
VLFSFESLLLLLLLVFVVVALLELLDDGATCIDHPTGLPSFSKRSLGHLVFFNKARYPRHPLAEAKPVPP